MAFDVGVHDWFEVLEFTVLQKVDDVDLEKMKKREYGIKSRTNLQKKTLVSHVALNPHKHHDN